MGFLIFLVWTAIIATIILVWIHFGWIIGVITAIALFFGTYLFDEVRGQA
jgi:hypothetical protein